jgi:hypothetical protein
MTTHAPTEARKLRGRLNHPIIDADGHCDIRCQLGGRPPQEPTAQQNHESE